MQPLRVWCVPLETAPEILAELEDTLSPSEIARANRFARPPLRDAYVAGRGMLRVLLANEMGAAVDEVEIVPGVKEKPMLGGVGRGKLHFNISHSGGYWLAAIGWSQEIGVDIEAARKMSDREDVARRFFSEGEVADLMSLPGEERVAAFYRCWTRKEAFLKATGEGLTYGLSRFRVSLLPGVPAAMLEMDGRPPSPDWRMRNLDLSPVASSERLFGAICWHGPERDVELRTPKSVEAFLAAM